MSYFFYEQKYYCLVNNNGHIFNEGTSIVTVSLECNSIVRTFFSDLQKRVQNGESEYTSTIPFVRRYNEIEMNGKKIDKKEFYKAANKVLGSCNVILR